MAGIPRREHPRGTSRVTTFSGVDHRSRADRHFRQDHGASAHQTFDPHVHGLPELLRASERGANGSSGLRYDPTEIMSGVTEVPCYRTAVVVEPEHD